MAPLETRGEAREAYIGAWSEIARAMQSGTSWSGHERNVAWLSLDGDDFVDASSVTGLDHVDDGRVALRCDWDRDGDEDLWLRFRSGPMLRYLENTSDPARYVEWDPGRVGASTHLGSESARGMALESRSADGYLASPPTRRVVALTGEESDAELFASAASRDDLRVGESAKSRPALPAGALEALELPTRVVLRTPLVLPPARLRALGLDEGRAAHLVVVADPGCERCASQLPGALDRLGDVPAISITTLMAGNSDDTPSVSFLSIAALSVLGPGAALDTPLAMLIDRNGALQALYLAGLDPDTVTQDAQWLAIEPVQGAFRSTTGTPGRTGRWFHGMPRSYTTLIEELVRGGHRQDAEFYSSERR